jgi:membrane protein YdbS with pleckstrin-like domain
VLTDQTAIWTTGLLRSTTDYYPLSRVTNVAIQQGRFDRRWGCGTLKIWTNPGHVYRFKNIEIVEDARVELEARVTAQRLEWRKHAH